PNVIMAEIYENAADYCMKKRGDNKFEYDDKVVYLKAQDELRKATKDPAYAADAQRRINQLQPLVPTKEDLFMHNNRTDPKGGCYDWIR
ncbi:MAG: hypothetical protein WAN36_00440, partial [Calditrichia bacterium]